MSLVKAQGQSARLAPANPNFKAVLGFQIQINFLLLLIIVLFSITSPSCWLCLQPERTIGDGISKAAGVQKGQWE